MQIPLTLVYRMPHTCLDGQTDVKVQCLAKLPGVRQTKGETLKIYYSDNFSG